MSNSQNQQHLIVANRQWQARLARYVGVYAEDVLWFDNVYEAVARVVSDNGRMQALTVWVVVDILMHHELGIFTTLKKLGRFRTVAVAIQDNPEKLEEARALGADDVVVLEDAEAQPAPETKQEAQPKPEAPTSEWVPLAGGAAPEKKVSEAQAGAAPASQPEPQTAGHSPTPCPRTGREKESVKETITIKPEAKKSESEPAPTRTRRRIPQPVLTKEELDALLG